jgi:hypothetical protein
MNYSWNIYRSINRNKQLPKVMILKSSSSALFININLNPKVLKGSGIFIKLSRASNRKTKQLNMAIKQVLANKPSRASV